MSATPRTDAHECEAITNLGRCVGVNFARQLERELAEARAEIASTSEDHKYAAEIMARMGVSPSSENSLEKLMLVLEARQMVAARERDDLRAQVAKLTSAFLKYIEWHGPCLDCHPDETDLTPHQSEAKAVDDMVNAALSAAPADCAKEIKELREDKARLDWLDSLTVMKSVGVLESQSPSLPTIRAAIDAARAKEVQS